jgi:hypothetical protein
LTPGTAGFAALIFAQRAFWAATRRARPAALGPPFFFGALAATGLVIVLVNGTEFHNYRELESILGTQVYFATPHHAWERGTN